MKKVTTLLLVVFTLVLSSCSKDEVLTTPVSSEGGNNNDIETVVEWNFDKMEVLSVIQNTIPETPIEEINQKINELYQNTQFSIDRYANDSETNQSPDDYENTGVYTLGNISLVTFKSEKPRESIRIVDNNLKYTKRFNFYTENGVVTFIGSFSYSK